MEKKRKILILVGALTALAGICGTIFAILFHRRHKPFKAGNPCV